MLTLAALALAVPLAHAVPDAYDFELRLERGGQTRTFGSHVRPAESFSAVTTSSGTRREGLIVNVMAVPEDDPDRVELMYQVEWSVPGWTIQAQDVAQLSLREDALLCAEPGVWSLRATLKPSRDVDTCTPAPSGGGLQARVRARRGGRERVVTRRTVPAAMSNIVVALDPDPPLIVGLEVTPTVPGRPADVRYAIGTEVAMTGGVHTKAKVPWGSETLVDGDGKEDGVWVTLEEATPMTPPQVVFPDVRDEKTGWRRYSDPVLTLTHPPGWAVRTMCDKTLKPDSWGFIDTTLPEEKRGDVSMLAFLMPPTNATLERLAERNPEDRSAGEKTTILPVALSGGRCLLRRVDSDISGVYGFCEFNGGRRLQVMMTAQSIAERFEDFKRLVASFALATPAP